jgi:signal transduction histidine kinase
MDTLDTWMERHAPLLRALAADLGLEEGLVHQRLREALAPPPEHDPLLLLNLVIHELRSPLVTLRGYVEMMATGRLGPTTPLQEKSMKTALRSAATLEEVMETALYFTRLQRGRCAPNTQRVPLRRCLERPLRALADAAASKGLDLRQELPDDPEIALQADPEQLAVALRLLLDNAIKYTERGHVLLRAALHGATLRLRVEDTGVGIDPAQIPRAFLPFVRLHDQSRGLGLGLCVARGLLEANGAALHLESQPQQGARLWFDLPLAL